MRNVTNKARELRRRLGLRQADVAVKAGVQIGQVSNAEDPKIYPVVSPSVRARIAKALGAKPEDLWPGTADD